MRNLFKKREKPSISWASFEKLIKAQRKRRDATEKALAKSRARDTFDSFKAYAELEGWDRAVKHFNVHLSID